MTAVVEVVMLRAVHPGAVVVQRHGAEAETCQQGCEDDEATDRSAGSRVRRRQSAAASRGSLARCASTWMVTTTPRTMKLSLCSPRTGPSPGPIASNATPVARSTPTESTRSGPRARKQKRWRALRHVGRAAGVVAGEAVPGACELQENRRNQQHADEDVPGEQRIEREDGQRLRRRATRPARRRCCRSAARCPPARHAAARSREPHARVPRCPPPSSLGPASKSFVSGRASGRAAGTPDIPARCAAVPRPGSPGRRL